MKKIKSLLFILCVLNQNDCLALHSSLASSKIDRKTAFVFSKLKGCSILNLFQRLRFLERPGYSTHCLADQSRAIMSHKTKRSFRGLLSCTFQAKDFPRNSTFRSPFFPLSELKSLEQNLSSSVRDERYEEASIIRDRIRFLRLQDDITRLSLMMEDAIAGDPLHYLTDTFYSNSASLASNICREC